MQTYKRTSSRIVNENCSVQTGGLSQYVVYIPWKCLICARYLTVSEEVNSLILGNI